jgi:choline dehydrogenase
LKEHGIDVVVNRPGVGQNLQDHYQMRTVVQMRSRDSLNNQIRNPISLLKMGLDWAFRGRGALTVGAGQVGGAMRTDFAPTDQPDLQLFVMPLSVDKPGEPLHRYPGFTSAIWQCHPKSRGSIEIVSPDPTANPKIQPNYLADELDQKTMVEGIKILRQIYNQPKFRDLWDAEIVPGEQVRTDAEIIDAIRKGGGTVYHPVGTCKMGIDAAAVVGPDLQVHGVTGLRVVDASIMPLITSANTNAPTLMIAEKAAEMILASGR